MIANRVQVRHPILDRWVKLDTLTGRIIAVRRALGPWANVSITHPKTHGRKTAPHVLCEPMDGLTLIGSGDGWLVARSPKHEGYRFDIFNADRHVSCPLVGTFDLAARAAVKALEKHRCELGVQLRAMTAFLNGALAQR